jgi:hypothetical protein
MNTIILTNNALVSEKMRRRGIIRYEAARNHLGILKLARDYIHAGHELLTHPVSGSIKPNETPFKTIALSADRKGLSYPSLELIEAAVASCEKFESSCPSRSWPDSILKDFALIDYDLIRNALGE